MATPRVSSNSPETQSLRDALAQLRLRLLDLTGRNRLLNYRHPIGKSLAFVEGQPAALFGKLAEGKAAIAIKGLPEPTRADWELKNERWSRPDPREWASRKGIPTSYDLPHDSGPNGDPDLRALMYRDDLAKHCRKIERESILAIEETGANMLYLVLGFLDFVDQKESDRIFSAPLLCVPVALSKKEANGSQQFFVRYTGDDIGENLSLREKLRQDHALILPELDEEEIDIEEYFSGINKIIKSRVGFALRRRVSLCLLSFTNMLLVRDLDPENWPQNKQTNGLLDHHIVKTVFAGSDPQQGTALTSEEYAAEEEPARSIPLIFDADSSQHSALVDVLANKRNLVIEGPPGTGKSQTITNLIAASLAKGQRVLFVAEKLAALQVVRSRLSIAGLDPFVLELHSTKTSKKQVLEQIVNRLEFRVNTPSELSRKLQELDSHRKELKAYADLLNTDANTQFGLTLHEVMWRAEKYRQKITKGEGELTEIAISDAQEITALELSRRMQSLEHLSEQYLVVGGFTHDHPFWGLFPRPMVPGDELRLGRVFSQCCELAKRLLTDANNLTVTVAPEVRVNRDEGVLLRNTLSKFATVTDERLPLHLLGGFIEPDGSGQLARREFEKLRGTLQAFHNLTGTVQAGLIREESASPELLVQLKQLQKMEAELGCAFGSTAEISKLSSALGAEADKLDAALAGTHGFCKEQGIPFNSTPDALNGLASLAEVILNVPEEHLQVQNERLTDPQSISTLEHLSSLQSKWSALERDLSQSLFLDYLPDDAALTQAIVTLRQGHAWYRILQPSWRSAMSLHQKLLRHKTKMQASARLKDLHRLVDLKTWKTAWKSDAAWGKYLGIATPDGPVSFDSWIAVAKWNRAVILAMENAGAQLFEPGSLTPARAREHRRKFKELNKYNGIASSSLESILALLPGIAGKLPTIEELLRKIRDVCAMLERYIPLLTAKTPSSSTLQQAIASCEAALERKRLAGLVEDNQTVKALLKEQFLGVNTDADRMLACVAVAEEVNKLPIPLEFRRALLTGNAAARARDVLSALDPVLTDLGELDKFALEMRTFGDFDLQTWIGVQLTDGLPELARRFDAKARVAASHIDDAIPWSVYVSRRSDVKQLGLSLFLALLEQEHILPNELSGAYAYATYASIVRDAFRKSPQLGKFSGLKHSKLREEFKRLDREIIQLRGKDVAAHCIKTSAPPSGTNGTRVDEKTEMVLVNYLLPQQRPRMPVRKMLKRAGRAVQALKPCFMMGPQAVAQYLTPGAMAFDMVIMDEASQLKPEEAIGAIARGAQLVVVGDPKQLPPTTFFTRMTQVGEDDDQFTTTDAESILDVCVGHFRPTRQLRWHYRSQHHSLIAFSNHYFYRNLVVFPSPYGHSSRLGIRATYLADAVYEDQTNYKEAIRVVDAVIDHIKSRPDESLLVATLNIKQRDLIAELLEERLQGVPGADAYRERWASEARPLVVKNLENVQGDERDAIVISTTFGRPTGSEAVRQNFGPISRQGGWRRLNVLFTRAKKSIALFTSMRPEDIIIDGNTPEGTKALRNYLEYARTGLLATTEETGAEPESDFEVSVINLLKARGYEVTPQLGVAGYRIDIAVKHPEYPGAYLAAIECDGAGYHSALSVRDRDRIRQEILESMGWRGRIWRIWSTDWFRTPRLESEKLVRFLEGLRTAWKPEHSSGQSWVEIGKRNEVSEPGGNGSSHVEEIKSGLLGFDNELTVRVGDTVRYVDVKKVDDVLTVQITEDKTDIAGGFVHRGTPLAHTLLGAVVGDEVTMHLPGASPRTFRIIEVKRSSA